MPELALLGGQVRRVVAPDAVLVADRAAARDDRLARGGLQRAPALERLVRVGGEPEDVRRVQARAARVDVREVAERVDALAVVVEPVAERLRRRPLASSRGGASSRPPSRACRTRSRPPTARRAGPARGTGRDATSRPRPGTPTAPCPLAIAAASRTAPRESVRGGRSRRRAAAPGLGDASCAEVGAERADLARMLGQREERPGLDRGREADHRQRQAGSARGRARPRHARGQSGRNQAGTPRRVQLGDR